MSGQPVQTLSSTPVMFDIEAVLNEPLAEQADQDAPHPFPIPDLHAMGTPATLASEPPRIQAFKFNEPSCASMMSPTFFRHWSGC